MVRSIFLQLHFPVIITLRNFEGIFMFKNLDYCVGIRPRINHIKLDKHTQRLNLSPSVRIARSKLCNFITPFSGVTTRGITRWPALACIQG
jgi:hypothetical protein